MANMNTPSSRGYRYGLSRRTFLKTAAAGTLGAGLFHPCQGDALGPEKEVGTITLDALMLSYVGAVPGNGGSSVFMPLKGYSTIFNLSVPGLALTAAVAPEQDVLGFYRQSQSQKAAGALDLMPLRDSVIKVNIGAGAPEDSAIYGLLAPTLKLKGTPEQLKFHLTGRLKEFAVEISQLLASPSMFSIGQDTASSMAGQYVSNVADLVAPRYLREAGFVPGESDQTLTFSTAEFGASGVEAVVTSQIIAQTGFTSTAVKDALAVGNNVTMTYSSAFEKESARVLSLEISPGDVAFNTFLDTALKSVVLAPA